MTTITAPETTIDQAKQVLRLGQQAHGIDPARDYGDSRRAAG